MLRALSVLVPFYRGAVVFKKPIYYFVKGLRFSSPFIEERLYLDGSIPSYGFKHVLVPFYRGAVVFLKTEEEVNEWLEFSSPFIEERLYFCT